MYGYIYNSDSGHDGIKKMIKVYEIEKKVKKKVYNLCDNQTCNRHAIL